MHHPLHKVKKFIQASLALIIFIFLSVSPQNSWSQIQLGADIDGEAIDNRSGKSVAISSDGSRIAVGAIFNNGNGSHSGHVRIFEWNGAAWIQLGLDIDGEAAGDRSGNSVSLSGDASRVAIGAPYNDGNGSESGHVRVFEWNGTAWIQLGTDIDGEAADDLFGQSVSLSASGSIVAIGSYRHGSDIEGHVRIYVWNGAAWFQRGSDIDEEGMFDESGSSVSLSSDGSRVAISALYNDGNGVDAGHVRVFGWNVSNWSQVGADLDGEAAGDGFGEGVSMSADGSRVAIGAPSNVGNGSGAGHVRIYEWDGSSWNQLGSDINGEAAGDFSGESVSLSGDGSRVIIGASSNSHLNGVSAGHASMFNKVCRGY